MYEGKTLVPILCMHRSGSSLTTSILAELGMSLGPFDLIGGTEHNPHGHFESLPLHDLNQQVQRLVLGFDEDMPESPESLRRYIFNGGRWPEGVQVPSEWHAKGEELIQGLLASGPVSGFKDPRVPLVWPFWLEVLQRMPGLRVMPLVLVRSPHEIAMSIFIRSQGRLEYCEALDVTAVHFQRLGSIMADWRGPLARIRFLPEHFANDLRATCRLLGLTWNEEVYARVFDPECKHHEAAVIAHPAQMLFEQLATLPSYEMTRENLAKIEADAAIRERVLRQFQKEAEAATAAIRSELAGLHDTMSVTEADARRLANELSFFQAECRMLAEELAGSEAAAKRLAADLSASRQELQRLATDLSSSEIEAKRLAARSFVLESETQRLASELIASQTEAKELAYDLRLVKASRIWRLREVFAALPVLKRLCNRLPLTVSASPEQDAGQCSANGETTVSGRAAA